MNYDVGGYYSLIEILLCRPFRALHELMFFTIGLASDRNFVSSLRDSYWIMILYRPFGIHVGL
jgi:hypothetical protein